MNSNMLSSLRISVALTVLFLICGCTQLLRPNEFKWREAAVIRVVRLGGAMSGVDSSCIPAGPRYAAGNKIFTEYGVVVEYRVWPVRLAQVFPVLGGREFRPGDKVAVSPAECLIELA